MEKNQERGLVPARPLRIQSMVTLMYQLRRNTDNVLDKNFGGSNCEEKESSNVYLTTSQWEMLDKIAEEKGISRNKALRRILEEVKKEADNR